MRLHWRDWTAAEAAAVGAAAADRSGGRRLVNNGWRPVADKNHNFEKKVKNSLSVSKIALSLQDKMNQLASLISDPDISKI